MEGDRMKGGIMITKTKRNKIIREYRKSNDGNVVRNTPFSFFIEFKGFDFDGKQVFRINNHLFWSVLAFRNVLKENNITINEMYWPKQFNNYVEFYIDFMIDDETIDAILLGGNGEKVLFNLFCSCIWDKIALKRINKYNLEKALKKAIWY